VTQRPPEVDAEPRGDDFRFGCDLFHHGFYWEAHEQWEALWHRLPRGAPERLFVQGLIQAAAALLKRRMGREDAVARLVNLAAAKIRAAARARREPFGVANAGAFVRALEAWEAGAAAAPRLLLAGA
jgi:predicted metal-dependent hydrolase